MEDELLAFVSNNDVGYIRVVPHVVDHIGFDKVLTFQAWFEHFKVQRREMEGQEE